MSSSILQVIILILEHNIRLDPNATIGHNKHLLTAIITQAVLDVCLESTLGRASTRDAVVLQLHRHLLEARQLAIGRHARAAEQTGSVLLRDGFIRRDRGGEDADVGFDDGPVHGVGDHPRWVVGGEHGRDVGDSDDGRYACAGEC